MSDRCDLSLILPAYNEAGRIDTTLGQVHDFLRGWGKTYEILVVNDGSSDDTADRVRALADSIEHVALIDSQPNHGKGFVVRLGMLRARGACRVFMDADHSFEPGAIDDFARALL